MIINFAKETGNVTKGKLRRLEQERWITQGVLTYFFESKYECVFFYCFLGGFANAALKYIYLSSVMGRVTCPNTNTGVDWLPGDDTCGHLLCYFRDRSSREHKKIPNYYER